MGQPYVIAEGDTLSSIAEAHGLPDWKKLYFADENKAYRTLRGDPNRIFPGDEIMIPGDPEDQELLEMYGGSEAGMDGGEADWNDEEEEDVTEDEPHPEFIPFADEDDRQAVHQVCRQNVNTINTRPAGFPWFSA
jgi:hypothetical protein